MYKIIFIQVIDTKNSSRKLVRCTENKLKLNLKNYWFNYDFYCLLYFINMKIDNY